MNKKFKLIIILFINIILTIVNISLIYNMLLLKNVETTLRVIIIIILILIYISSIYISFKIINKKDKIIIIFSIILLLYSIVLYFISFNIGKVYKSLSGITNNYMVTSMSIVTLSNHHVNYNDGTIGYINTSMSLKILDNNALDNRKLNDNYVELLNNLYDGQVDFAIVPTNYKLMFNNLIDKNLDEISIVRTFEEKIKVENNNQKIDKPFTILLMGVDSEIDGINNSSFNGDALMLITFNPKTLSTTLLSIPRDTYVPISCFENNRKNKITHAAWNGDTCMINTVESFFDIHIDYYLKINFKGIVSLVDELGGVEVDVPISFCEQDSNRNFDNQICLDKGTKLLNGEEALALARYRKTINDIKRGENQQLIVKGLMNKLKSIKSVNTIYNLLDTISNNMETNMNTNEILSLYNIGKEIVLKSNSSNIDEIIKIKKLFINGYDAYIYDYDNITKAGTKLTLYNYIPYTESIDAIKTAMKINLGLLDGNLDESDEIGRVGSGANVYVFPNFVGDNISTVKEYCDNKGIKLNIKYVTSKNNNLSVGEVTNQSIMSGMDLEYIGSDTLDVTVIEKIEKEEVINCSKEESKDKDICKVPNFINKNYSDFVTWRKSNNYSFLIKENKIDPNNPLYDYSKKGMIISQNPKNISIYDLIGNTFEITYISDEY